MLRSFAGTGVRTVLALPDPADPAFWSRHCREHRVIADPRKHPLDTVRDLVRTAFERPDEDHHANGHQEWRIAR